MNGGGGKGARTWGIRARGATHLELGLSAFRQRDLLLEVVPSPVSAHSRLGTWAVVARAKVLGELGRLEGLAAIDGDLHATDAAACPRPRNALDEDRLRVARER